MPEHDLTRTDRMALYIRARADAKAARDEAVRVVEGENAALSEVPCARRPSARAKGLGASCGAGTAPADLTVTGLAKALPYSWAEQESSIGFPYAADRSSAITVFKRADAVKVPTCFSL